MGNFKNVFKELRMKLGYTQDGLAEAIGLSRSAISMYENGNREPDFETLEKIADFFHVDADCLLGRSAKPDPIPTVPVSVYEPTFEDIQSLIARNGKNLTIEQKQEIIRSLLSEN